jgi:hypothetical protein
VPVRLSGSLATTLQLIDLESHNLTDPQISFCEDLSSIPALQVKYEASLGKETELFKSSKKI